MSMVEEEKRVCFLYIGVTCALCTSVQSSLFLLCGKCAPLIRAMMQTMARHYVRMHYGGLSPQVPYCADESLSVPTKHSVCILA